ncbi:HIT family protein [Microlunatus soli]|uniref:HIT family protein n=1 Tax=Microlunatus soli TaxID=630515 RepID=UPI001E5D7A80|nr:HIT family protein [Microlunatus soli]
MSVDVICRIVAGDLDAEIVHRDDDLIAFLDHRPVFKGHVLIAPVRHIDDLLSLPGELMQPMLGLGQRLSRAFITALGAQGSFTAINTIISQSIPHLHMHVVPRSKGDGLRGFFWPRTRYADGEAAEYGQLITSALADLDLTDA